MRKSLSAIALGGRLVAHIDGRHVLFASRGPGRKGFGADEIGAGSSAGESGGNIAVKRLK